MFGGGAGGGRRGLMIWGLFFFIYKLEETFSWREIGYGKKIGKVEGCEVCLGIGICKAPLPGGSDVHPDRGRVIPPEGGGGKEERMGSYAHTLGPGSSSKQRREKIVNLDLEGLPLGIVKAVSSPEAGSLSS